jgi:hypothetical protein
MSHYRDLDCAFAVPNGGTRHLLEAMNLKRSGVKAGVPDIFIPIARDCFHGLFLEMKSEKGKVSEDQIAFMTMLSKNGYKCVVCHGFDAAKNEIEYYLAQR